jgi:hypothetical protein
MPTRRASRSGRCRAPGNVGADTTANYLTVLTRALAWSPAEHIQQIEILPYRPLRVALRPAVSAQRIKLHLQDTWACGDELFAARRDLKSLAAHADSALHRRPRHTTPCSAQRADSTLAAISDLFPRSRPHKTLSPPKQGDDVPRAAG